MKQILTHGTYPNDYIMFAHLIQISETQASEFLDKDFGTWTMINKGFVCIPGNDGGMER